MRDLNICPSITETITSYRVGKFDGEIVQYQKGLYRWEALASNWLSVEEYILGFSKPATSTNSYYEIYDTVTSSSRGITFKQPVFLVSHLFNRPGASTTVASVSFRANGVNIFTDNIPVGVSELFIQYPLTNPLFLISNLTARHSLFYASATSTPAIISEIRYRNVIV